jgi:uncharacterized protein YbjT (DUF2867 family)
MGTGKEAILVGATGLIGNSLLQQLLEEDAYTKITAVVRRKLPNVHPKLKQVVTDFDDLNARSEEIRGDVVFCALGTTNSKTPDKAQYRKIDYQYPLDIARIAQHNGATQYHLVSSMGADPSSSFFYTRLKGEVEHDLQQIPFKSIHIYRPSLLDGDRKEHRTAESFMTGFMRIINPLLVGSLKKYRSIRAEKVASAMIKQSLIKHSLADAYSPFIYPSDQIEALS